MSASAKLTRKALYELVWSRPRTTLAREMGVSDVWIGKQCRALDVPAPPPGYWASLAAGGKPKTKYLRPPLTYTVAERMQEDHDLVAHGLEGFDPADLAQVIPPAPVFAEAVEQAVARYAGLARAQAARRRAPVKHPVVQRLLAEDERRASLASPYDWQQPLYRGTPGRAILQALDRLVWRWSGCGFRVAASGGHTVELSVSGGAGGGSSRFEIRAAPLPEREARRGRPLTRPALEFWLDPDRDARQKSGKPALVFDTMDDATIDALTTLVITAWERRFRAWLVWRHDNAVESRDRAVRAVQDALRRERERREAEVRALHGKRHRLLLRAIDRAQRAQEIRGFVADMVSSPAVHGVDAATLARWTAWALGQADAMDLRAQPSQAIGVWLEEFDLGAEDAG